jgi:hypothetical protein
MRPCRDVATLAEMRPPITAGLAAPHPAGNACRATDVRRDGFFIDYDDSCGITFGAWSLPPVTRVRRGATALVTVCVIGRWWRRRRGDEEGLSKLPGGAPSATSVL